MASSRGHSADDQCVERACSECGKKFRHDHDCGVWVCSGCKSIDLKRTKLDDGTGDTLRVCLNCGGATTSRMSIRDRLAIGA